MTLEEFVFNVPLYDKIDATNGYNDIIKSLIKQDYNTIINGYNTLKKCETTFYLHKGISNLQQYTNYISYEKGYGVSDDFVYSNTLLSKPLVGSIIFRCKRYGDNIVISVFHDHKQNLLIKVGQYPSVADIHIGQVKQYDKVLEKPIMKEFTKAIGLAANGIGIGSFVYLRRIFENLIFDAYNEAKNDNAIDEKQFDSMRMDERIKSLKGYLPSFIVENNGIYGILSKGIHELTEEECLAYFDCMRKSIELILDERLELLAKKKKIEEVKKTLNAITSQIKNNT